MNQPHDAYGRDAPDAKPPPVIRRGLHRFESQLEADILRFQEIAYPHRPKTLIGPRWRWMFLESAARCGVDPYVWIHHDGSRVTAHQGAIAVRFWDGSKETSTGWFVETMALPEVRGATIGPAVVMKAKQDLPLNLSLGQTSAMRELQFRLGWQQVAQMQTYLLMINPSKVLRQKLPTPLTSLASAWFQFRRAARRLASVRTSLKIEVRDVDHFDCRYDQLWNDISHCYGCAVVRDATYLQWKYVDQPGQSFVRLEVLADGQLIGCVVLSVFEADATYSYRRAHIVEMVCATEPARLAATIQAAVDRSRHLQADAVFMHLVNTPIQQALERAGFIKRPPTRYLLVSLDASADRTRMLNADRWLITSGDSDIDRPW